MTQLLCCTHPEEIASNVNVRGDRADIRPVRYDKPLCDALLIFELASGTLTSIPEMKFPTSNQNRREVRYSRRRRHRCRRRLVV